MHELTLSLPEDLYDQLEAQAESEGVPLEGFILEQLAAHIRTPGQSGQEKHLLRKALATTGLVQPLSSDLIATYVSDPSAPRQSPVQVRGKPLSTVIIEQRGTLK